jgi:selenocysteine-specific elongation factor
MTLASPGLLRTTDRADVQVTLLKGARPLKLNSAVHFHCYTSEMTAEVVPLEGTQLDAKQAAFAQLRFPKPLLLLPGDRFILRQFSPVVTIGGGVVLDAFPLKQRGKKISPEQRVEFLHSQLVGSDAEQLLARIERRAESGLSLADAAAETGLLPQNLKQLAAELVKNGKVSAAQDVYIVTSAVTNARARLASTLDDFHKANPLSTGMNKEELGEKLGLPDAVFDSLLQSLAAEKQLTLTGDTVTLAGRGVVMKDEEADAKRTIEDAFSKAGLKVPGLKEVVASLPLDKARAQKLVTLLLRDRILIKLGDDLVFHRSALDALKEQIRAHKAKSPKIDVATFKDLTGISRKYAIPLLEHLDRERVTRREGDARVIL